MMKTLAPCAALALAAAPAIAQAPTTLEAVIAHGIVMQTRFGFDVPVTYAPDGKFTAEPPGQALSGQWRIEGGRTLCTRVGSDPTETCATYPDGKRSGDTFEVDGAMGPAMGVVTIRIR